MSESRRNENLILILALICFSGLSYILFNDELLDFENLSESESIARIFETQNDVRFKSSKQFVWKKASENKSLTWGDAVFSGNDSTSTIKLKDGALINLQADSMIVLNKLNDQMELELKFGQVKAEISKNMQIKLPCESLSVEGERSALKLGPGCAIQTIRGSATYKPKVAIDPTATQEIRWREKLQKTHLHSNQNVPLFLSWNRGKFPKGYTLEYSSDPEVKSIEKKISLSTNQILLNDYPKNGKYFFRLRAYSEHEKVLAESKIAAIEFKEVSSPLILTPAANERFGFQFDPDGNALNETDIEAAWAFPFENYQFEVELTKKDSPQLVPQKFSVRGTKFIFKELTAGHYSIRVRSLPVDSQVFTDWSQESSFFVRSQRINSLAAPQIRPLEINSVFGSKQKPIIEWNPVRGAASYQVEWSAFQDFKTTQRAQTVETSFVLPLAKEPGKVFYRVLAKTVAGSFGSPSLPGKYENLSNAPTLSPIANISIFAKSPREPDSAQTIPLKWTNSNGASVYSVEVSQDPGFEDFIVYSSTKTNLQILAKTPGKFFVRVKPLNSKREPAADYSNVQMFNYDVEQPLDTPKVKEPLNNITFFLQKNETPKFWIAWESVRNADQYNIEVSAEPNFKKVILNKKTSSRKYLVDKKFSDGVYFFRLQAINQKGSKSHWSDSRKFKISSGRAAGEKL